jgi:hypothetical protein
MSHEDGEKVVTMGACSGSSGNAHMSAERQGWRGGATHLVPVAKINIDVNNRTGVSATAYEHMPPVSLIMFIIPPVQFRVERAPRPI